jgi:hypothetical protein
LSLEYKTWQSIKARCYDPRSQSYPRYGAVGIKMCDRWLNSFAAFAADMGPRPTPKHTIDRIDNARGYEPNNCRWATMQEQQMNRRNNRWITAHGETLSIKQWERKLGIDHGVIADRIRRGYPLELALSRLDFRSQPRQQTQQGTLI